MMPELSDMYSSPGLLAVPKIFFPGHVYQGPRALRFLRELKGEILFVVSRGAWERHEPALAGNLDSPARDIFWADPEPTVKTFRDFAERLAHKNYQYVIGFGGGSAMDVAKTARIRPTGIDARGVKVILIPTTAGSGSEVSRYALFINEAGEKEPMVSADLLPDTVLYDPSFLLSLPPDITAYTTADAYAHALEGLTSRLANPLSDVFAREAARLILAHALSAYREPDNLEARSRLQIAGFFGGLAQNSASVGLAHGLADFFGPRWGMAHGLAVALFLPPVIAQNLKKNPAYYEKLGPGLADSVYEETRRLFGAMGLEGIAEKFLADAGAPSGAPAPLGALVGFLKKDPAAKTHPFMPNEDELKEILDAAHIAHEP